MSKTEVILTHNVMGLGAESDQVKVTPGYARNYLFPKGLAIPLTAANRRQLEVLRQRRAEREAHELNTMTELAKSLTKMTLAITVKTGEDGKMFGSVTAGTIADELKQQFEIALDKKKIHLEHPIRTLGEHDIEMRLHSDIVRTLKISVESSTPVVKPALAVSPPGKSKEGKEAKGEIKSTAKREAKFQARGEAKSFSKSEPKKTTKAREEKKPAAK